MRTYRFRTDQPIDQQLDVLVRLLCAAPGALIAEHASGEFTLSHKEDTIFIPPELVKYAESKDILIRNLIH